MEFIPVASPILEGRELEYVTDCIKSGWVSSSGKYVKQFEDEFASFCNAKYAVSTSSGTSALHLALKALGIKEGDEVIVPNFTFLSTANVVVHCNAKPVFVDVDKETWNMDIEKLKEKITERTKAIIPVHIYGHPCDMDSIMEIAKKHNLLVIEDSAEAHGAEYKGKKVGSIGDAGCFSFYGNKVITTGEGGMVVTNNLELDEKMRILRDHGVSKTKKYDAQYAGFNYRITNIQAALGLAQMERIDEFIDKKRKNAKYYNKLLKDIKGIILPAEKEWAKNIFWMYSIVLTPEFPISRDELMEKLKENNIESRPFFPTLHNSQAFKEYSQNETFPIAEMLASSGINLPSSPKLTKEQIQRIVRVIKTS